jgi:Skp family chaperone for outer membrane proteins
MKFLTKAAFAAAALTLAPMVAPTVAAAQTIAYSDYDMMIASSKTFKTADAQIKAQFKAVIDQANGRAQQLDAELTAMKTKFNTDYRANPNNPALPAAYKAIQDKEASAKAELGRILAPVDRAYAFVEEQLAAKLPQAVSTAMAKKRVSLLVRREAVLQSTPGTDLTQDIGAELSILVPSVSITPPAGWQAGQQQQAPASAAPSAAPTPTPKPVAKPQGR